MNVEPQTSKALAERGYSIFDILITIAFVALLAVVFLPALARSKARSSRIGCANDMKQIGIAFLTWSLDCNDRYPMQVSVTNGGTMELAASGAVSPHFQVMSNELSTPKVLLCPNDKKRSYATNFTIGLTDRNVSYFLNVDATNGNGSMLLAGDRNITNKSSTNSRLVPLTKADTIAWNKELHSEKGYLLFGDDTVNSCRNGSVGALNLGGRTTNRLAVP